MRDDALIEAEIQEIVDRYAALGVDCEPYLHDVEIFIDSLERDRTDPATKGLGARLMQEMCAVADRHGLPLELTHMRDEPGLGTYYSQFGLVHYDVPGGNPDLSSMVRPARSRH